MEKQNQKKVFVSYSFRDRDRAKEICRSLTDAGIKTILTEEELGLNESIVESLQPRIAASDCLVILLSKKAAQSNWLRSELSHTIDLEFKARDITMIPILLDNYVVPSYLSSYQVISLAEDYRKGLQELVERIKLIPIVDFSVLDGRAFENLIADLLRFLGFKDIMRQYKDDHQEFDIKAQYSYKDPFGSLMTDTWLTETKFYKESRLDLNVLSQTVSYLSSVTPDCKMLLVTNGHLTSASRNWFDSLKESERNRIRIIEGSELKTLLLKNKDLIEKYFSPRR